jgi:hypothetical protein
MLYGMQEIFIEGGIVPVPIMAKGRVFFGSRYTQTLIKLHYIKGMGGGLGAGGFREH